MSEAGSYIDDEIGCTCDGGLSHASCHDCGVRCFASLAGEDPNCGRHAVDVLGCGFRANQDGVLPCLGHVDGGVSVENHHPGGCPG